MNYTSSCRENQKLSTESSAFSKYYNISETLARGSINLPLYHGGGMILLVRPKGENIWKMLSQYKIPSSEKVLYH